MIININEVTKKPTQKISFKNNAHYDLLKIISNDLLISSKLPLFLFICIIVTAVMIIITAYNTRLLTTKHEQLILEHNLLDVEWRNLILEKNTLDEHSRIEVLATTKLRLQHINPLQENIVIQK